MTLNVNTTPKYKTFYVSKYIFGIGTGSNISGIGIGTGSNISGIGIASQNQYIVRQTETCSLYITLYGLN
ncbi:hypothetical protein PIROE2DRAFT_14941 [Piromyces sp. E2]|nr:hypothetical protein PIROE2DRAFT_14941 [Piromyces sp. E2]|eukprot:OUM59509.1 hypothetical protein PIROE2DRAFT_14941 [Piromyces sp. E2]